ncbi:MAG: dTMP kinase [Gammaproteobacteria bacterium]|nr:MAG: dTMP kinase [Gammaproteobacteria bacterium]
MSEQGRFVTIEGIEGAGKSTCMQLAARVISDHGIELVQTREPGGTPLGEELRDLLLGHRHTGMSEDAELLLMFAARAEHLHRRIEPALEQGQWVLCDRFTDATYAYQGAGRGIPKDRISVLEQWVQGARRPDLTILMDLPVTLGLERAGRRSDPDRFEREDLAFFERVRQGYREIAAREPQRVRVVDASRALATVQDEIRGILEAFMEQVGND